MEFYVPKNTRQWSLQKIDETVNLFGWCIYHLNGIAEKYRPVHPEVCVDIDEAIRAIELLTKYVKNIRKGI